MRPRLASIWLHSCSGCEMALVDSGEALLALLTRMRVVHFPLIMDGKYRANENDGTFDLPQAEIGLVSGGVATREHLALLTTLRQRCTTLIAMGTCATHGGIPALGNQWPLEQTLRTVYPEAGDDTCPVAARAALDRVYAVDEMVAVDVQLPGCPPRGETVLEVLDAVLDGRQPGLQEKSVCETCPTIRTGKGADTARRFLANADAVPGQPESAMRCLLEQGLLCLGPVTAGGCGGKETPLCLRARVPCRGCYGPVRPEGNPLLDMLNILASKGIDHRNIVDRRSLLRFCGAHGRIKPAARRR